MGSLLVHTCTNVYNMANDNTRNPARKKPATIAVKEQSNDSWHGVVTPTLNVYMKNIFDLINDCGGKTTADKWIYHYKKCWAIATIRSFKKTNNVRQGKTEKSTVDCDGGDVRKFANLSPYATSPFFRCCSTCNLDLTNMLNESLTYYIKIFSCLWHEHCLTLCNNDNIRTIHGIKYFRSTCAAINEYIIALFGIKRLTPYQQLKPSHMLERMIQLVSKDDLFENTLSFGNLKVELLHALRNLAARTGNKFGYQPYQTVAEGEAKTLMWQMESRDKDIETKNLSRNTDAMKVWISEQKDILKKQMQKQKLIEKVVANHQECRAVHGCCFECMKHFVNCCKQCKNLDMLDIDVLVNNIVKEIHTVDDVITTKQNVKLFLMQYPYTPVIEVNEFEAFFSLTDKKTRTLQEEKMLFEKVFNDKYSAVKNDLYVPNQGTFALALVTFDNMDRKCWECRVKTTLIITPKKGQMRVYISSKKYNICLKLKDINLQSTQVTKLENNISSMSTFELDIFVSKPISHLKVDNDKYLVHDTKNSTRIKLRISPLDGNEFYKYWNELKKNWTDILEYNDKKDHQNDDVNDYSAYNCESINNTNFEIRKHKLRKINKRLRMRLRYGYDSNNIYYGCNMKKCLCGDLVFDNTEGIPVTASDTNEKHLICPNSKADGTYKLFPKDSNNGGMMM